MSAIPGLPSDPVGLIGESMQDTCNTPIVRTRVLFVTTIEDKTASEPNILQYRNRVVRLAEECLDILPEEWSEEYRVNKMREDHRTQRRHKFIVAIAMAALLSFASLLAAYVTYCTVHDCRDRN